MTTQPTTRRVHRFSEQLDQDWSHVRTRRSDVVRARRWGEHEPVLRPHVSELSDLAELLATTQRRDGEDVLRALVAVAAGDPLAGRIVLQRILPGLIAGGARYRWTLDGIDPLEHSVAAAWFAIATFDPARSRGPVAALLISDAIDVAFRRPLRRMAAHDVQRPPHAFDEVIDPGEPTNAHDELVAVLRSARANGVDRSDIELLGAIARDGTRRLADRHAVTQRTVRNRRDAAAGRIRTALAIAA